MRLERVKVQYKALVESEEQHNTMIVKESGLLERKGRHMEIELDELPEPTTVTQTAKATSKPNATTTETKTTKKVEITSEDDEDDELPF